MPALILSDGFEDYIPTGNRRKVSFGYEGAANASLQGTDATIQLSQSIFLHEIQLSVSVKQVSTALPAALDDWDVLFQIAYKLDQEANTVGPATQFFPLLPDDPTFVKPVTIHGNASTNFGAGTLIRDTLVVIIVKGSTSTTGPIGGPHQDRAITKPEMAIPEGSFLIFHADEVMRAALTLDFEMTGTLTYTPIKRPQAIRR